MDSPVQWTTNPIVMALHDTLQNVIHIGYSLKYQYRWDHPPYKLFYRLLAVRPM